MELQYWTKQMEYLEPPSPQIKDEKMARFGFCLALSSISGGLGFVVPFYIFQDQYWTEQMKNLAPPPPQIKDGKMARLGFLVLDCSCV